MTRVILTYADYAALPDDGRRSKLHEGEVSVTPAPSTRHQRVKVNRFESVANTNGVLEEARRGRRAGVTPGRPSPRLERIASPCDQLPPRTGPARGRGALRDHAR